MYNQLMAVYEGKKVETLTVKVDSELREDFEQITKATDRSMSYIVRELALRGLVQYKLDGQLKITPDEEKIITSKNSKSPKSTESNFISIPDKGELDDEMNPKKKKKNVA